MTTKKLIYMNQLPRWMQYEAKKFFIAKCIQDYGDAYTRDEIEKMVDKNPMCDQIKNVCGYDGFQMYFMDVEQEELVTLTELVNDYNNRIINEPDYDGISFNDWFNELWQLFGIGQEVVDYIMNDSVEEIYMDEPTFYLFGDRYDRDAGESIDEYIDRITIEFTLIVANIYGIEDSKLINIIHLCASRKFKSCK